ncbi:bifunctional metallophosphatase/5'-nucleotidase [Actinomyces sp. oral taxon 171]|uniref:bifunctional metallophosphatase/5'-nucleotidase n=1 Tax=Actinomyces sp. oral taxon 171 TaxID=706438 RepID=UPI0001F61E8A|nr:5'-nucleotidase C-terminal domain-containing protein [Actinomyces sp. oral taxon 171]EFW26540.1 5'-nucleotidase, C-terminal domain protein [Actinomyces sp. oral taxon 171 str. F0337]QCT32415.1 bifunctional metallophosphatase/5'-nucleotidase [Actinomyces sp. oral taxon 171 str. F0337]
MRLHPTWAVKVGAVMCALTLTALSPSPLTPTAGADEPAAPADAPASGTTTIDLLGITDLHGHISRTTQTDRNTGQTSVEDPGAVTLACEVSAARATNPNTLFVSAGDSVGGSAYVSSILQDRPTMETLNAMSLDASALGNHELDQGLTDLETRILPASNFPILAANVSGSAPLSAEGVGKGVFIKEVGGVRVGFVGVVTDELPTLVSPSALSTLTLSPAVASANARAAELKDGDPANGEADVVVVLSHEDAATTATSFGGSVDAVFSGHTHVPFAQTVTGAEGNQIAVVQADHYGWALGRIRLSYDPASRKTSVVSADNKDLRSSNCTTDAYGVAGIVSQAEKDSATEGGKPLARIGSDFLRGSDGSGPGANRGTESTASNLIAESFRSWLATDIQPAGSTRYVGIMNAGGVRADLLYAASGSEGDGVLTSGEAYTVQPFGNEMAYTTLTGAELKALLSQQWQPGSSRPVLTLGLSSNVDVLTEASTDAAHGTEAGAAPAIREILVDGKPLADGDSVVVASNSFLLTGGDGYTVLKGKPVTNTGVLDRDVTSAYLASFGDQPVKADYSKRQTGMTVGPVYISSGGARSTDMVSVTLESLAYTNASEQAAGARRVRASTGSKEILTKDLDLTVDATGPTTGRVDFNLTFPDDAPTRACRTVQATTCRWATVETLDAAGTVLNRFSVEIEGEAVDDPGADAGASTAGSADTAADEAGGEATSTPQAGRDADEASVGGGTEPSAGSGAPPAAAAPEARGGNGAQPVGGSGGWPLARTGASLGAGVVALILIVGGYLILRRRRQVD